MDVTPERRWIPRRLPVELPVDSVVLERSRHTLRAMLPDGVVLLWRRHRNFDGATLAFREPLVRRHLVAERTLKVDLVESFELADGKTGRASRDRAPLAGRGRPAGSGSS